MGMTIALTMRSVTLETTPVRGSPAHPLVATTAIAKPSATMRVNANAMTAITMTQPLSLLAVETNQEILQRSTVSWVHGELGQHAARAAEQERKREPEVSPRHRLGQELHAVLHLNNRTATRMFVRSIVSWVNGEPGQHAARTAEQERKREPEVSRRHRLGQELHVVLLPNNRTATQMFVLLTLSF